MKVVNKSEEYARQFKASCVISMAYGVYIALEPIRFFASTMQTSGNEGMGMAGTGLLTLAFSLLAPVMLILAGVLGYLKKYNTVIVLSSIAFVICMYSLITNISTMVTVMDWKHMLAEVITLIPGPAIPVFFIVETILVKKHPQEK